jgi:hypothetical protein
MSAPLRKNADAAVSNAGTGICNTTTGIFDCNARVRHAGIGICNTTTSHFRLQRPCLARRRRHLQHHDLPLSIATPVFGTPASASATPRPATFDCNAGVRHAGAGICNTTTGTFDCNAGVGTPAPVSATPRPALSIATPAFGTPAAAFLAPPPAGGTATGTVQMRRATPTGTRGFPPVREIRLAPPHAAGRNCIPTMP